MSRFLRYFKLFWALFMALCLALTPLFDAPAADTPEAELVGEDIYVLNEALSMGQGITTDGKYYYTVGTVAAVVGYTALAKIDMETMERVAVKPFAIPAELWVRGNDHIGGIGYYDGKIYASLEDGDCLYPGVLVFDAETLECVAHYDFPAERHPDGVPWCAVDSTRGILCTSLWNHADELLIYDANTMEFLGTLPLSGEIDRIQGADFYNGVLYLSADVEREGKIKKVWQIDIDTGLVTLAFTRDVGKEGSEAEGMTVYPTTDGALFHVLDYNKLASTYLRHYKLK